MFYLQRKMSFLLGELNTLESSQDSQFIETYFYLKKKVFNMASYNIALKAYLCFKQKLKSNPVSEPSSFL